MAQTGDQPFDPFNHRLSRDLRNDLSEALLQALQAGDPLPVQSTADRYRARTDLPRALVEYLEQRLLCYRQVMAEAAGSKEADQGRLARSFWNHELFFEFHELLEKRWLAAAGAGKDVLQALIRAAGTYILREAGRLNGAGKMALRAGDTIEKYREFLPPGFEADTLLAALANPDAPPPKFGEIARDSSSVGCQHKPVS